MLVAEEGVNEKERCDEVRNKNRSQAQTEIGGLKIICYGWLPRVKVILKHAIISFCATSFNSED